MKFTESGAKYPIDLMVMFTQSRTMHGSVKYLLVDQSGNHRRISKTSNSGNLRRRVSEGEDDSVL